MARGPAPQVILLPMRIWDSPTRLFHWALVVLLVTCYVAIRFNNMDLHMWSGYAVATLVLWRITWGLVGSDTARFAQFLKSPLAGLRHLLHFGRREPDTQVGHNEAGGWMVLAMLLIISVQVASGLFANDEDSFIAGPLAKLISGERGAWSLSVHQFNFNLIEALALAHVVAIILYAVVKRHDLVRPMISGKKRLPAATRAPRMASPLLAGVILLVWAGVVWVAVTKL
jgi:cytochrome b